MEDVAADQIIGQVIENRFEVMRLIGRGGMSDVYQARHLKVDLTVAVKILKTDFAKNQQNLERFKREAATVNSLFHPNIIHMYSYGFLDTGQPYQVIAYLEGKSLESLIKSGGVLADCEAVDIFVKVCRGVSEAHKAGVLHRDLKPANVMIINADDPEENVKVLDFGIAKQLTGQGKDMQELTQAGEVFGSPLYMSPEQCTGDEMDARSDIYSMGCLMYETLTGKPPFLGKHVVATMAMHMYEAPKPFSAAAPTRAIARALEAIVFKAMQKEREHRQQSMGELAEELKAVI